MLELVREERGNRGERGERRGDREKGGRKEGRRERMHTYRKQKEHTGGDRDRNRDGYIYI